MNLTYKILIPYLKKKGIQFQIEGNPGTAITGFSTDTRTAKPGNSFLAIEGDVYDGNNFTKDAIDSGANSLICKPGADRSGSEFSLVSDNPLLIFRAIAAFWREQFDIPVIAVAGSVGKTTTKEMISTLLDGNTEVLKTERSENGFLGIPKTLLNLNDLHRIAVIEVGIDEKGAMAQHLEIVKPDYGVITAISEEHLEKIGEFSDVVDEELRLFRYLVENGKTVFANLDDYYVRKWASKTNYKYTIGYTTDEEFVRNAKYLGKISNNFKKFTFSVIGSNKELFSTYPPLPGDHNATNLTGAVAVALELGTEPEGILSRISKIAPTTGRTQLESVGKIQIFNDTYNSNPASVKAALRTASQICRTTDSRLLICLGDMLELGRMEENYHRDIAVDIDRIESAEIFLFGDRMRWLFETLESLKFKVPHSHYDSIDELASNLLNKVKPGDLVLIKGSRGMKMERIIDAIKSKKG